MRLSFVLASFAVASLASLVGCSKPWPQHDFVATKTKLGDGSDVTILLPQGLTAKPGGMFESTDGPTFALAFGQMSATFDDYVKATPSGKGFEKRDVPGGYGTLYDDDVPHVHVERSNGQKHITCDGWMDGKPDDLAARKAMLWKSCASVDWTG